MDKNKDLMQTENDGGEVVNQIEAKAKGNKEQVINFVDNAAPSASDVYLGGKVVVKMERGNASWTTHSGVTFTRTNPFGLVSAAEAEQLEPIGFRLANAKEIREFYGK